MNSIAPLWKLLQITDDNPEYALFESVVEEITEISGWDIHYFIKLVTPENTDGLYGEDANTEYTDSYSTNLIYDVTDETNILDSFGITSDDTIQYMQIPKIIFKRDVGYEHGDENLKPKPGDVIRTLWNNKLYEIVDVGSEQNIFQGRKMVWEFITRPYRHAEESDSANELLFDTPEDFEFPDINEDTETKELSAYGENQEIQDMSDDISEIDTSFYGYT